MRVLLVHDEAIDAGYGAESYLRRLVAGLIAARDDVALVAGEVRHAGASRALDLWDPAARRIVRERAREFRPDVINFHNVTRELSASVLAAVPDVPGVMTVHDLRLLGGREHAALSPRGAVESVTTSTVRRVARRSLAATIGVSERVSDQLRARRFPDVTTIGVPVLAPVATGRPVAQCRDVAVIARLAPDKGIDVVIEAFASCVPDLGAARLLIAGDGPLRSTLERAASRLGNRVQFLGRLDEVEVSALLGEVRAVVVASVPSRRPEGSSMAHVEALAHGRPVIATDDPAVHELAQRLGGSIVVTAADPRALAVAMRELTGDGERAQRLGAEGRGNAERLHSVDAVVAATRAVYARVVTGRAA